MENTSISFQSAISRFSFLLCLPRESDRMRLFISYWIICFELSLNTCLHITYRTDMGTSRDESEQNGIVVSVHMTSKCCSSFFTMSLFFACRVQKCNFISKLKGNAHHMPCSWLKHGSDAMLSNTKQMDVKTRHSKVQLRAILKGALNVSELET